MGIMNGRVLDNADIGSRILDTRSMNSVFLFKERASRLRHSSIWLRRPGAIHRSVIRYLVSDISLLVCQPGPFYENEIA